VEPYQRLSPVLEKCCLRLAATASFGRVEKDIQLLTGMSVGHSRFCRYVQEHQLELPTAKQVVNEVVLDRGNVRLRHPEFGEPSYYRNYQAVRLQGMYYGAFFENALGLSGCGNTQPLAESVACFGDGPFGDRPASTEEAIKIYQASIFPSLWWLILVLFASGFYADRLRREQKSGLPNAASLRCGIGEPSQRLADLLDYGAAAAA